MRIEEQVKLDFKDVLIRPKRSTLQSRVEVDLEREYSFKYGKATWFWVQEEPLNMGAASFLQMNLKSFPFGVISRQASASTATGFQKVHQQEQADIIQMAFSI